MKETKKTNRTNCIIKGCREKATYRGLCRNHYAAAGRRVRMELTTWEKLESLGLSLPLVASPFDAATK